MLDLFIVNRDNVAAESLAKKLSGPHKPGEMIFVTDQEMQCLRGGDVERLTENTESAGSLQLIELKKGARYIAIVKDGRVNIDDIAHLCEHMTDIDIAIVRTR